MVMSGPHGVVVEVATAGDRVVAVVVWAVDVVELAGAVVVVVEVGV